MGERAHLLVSSQGATRIYRTPKKPAESTDHLNAMILAINEVDRAVTTGQPRVDLRRY